MKRLIRLLIILVSLYFIIELSFINLNKGHSIEYTINSKKNKFLVKEIYVQKTKNEKRNYYFEIKINDDVFNYQTYKDYKKANYIIKKLDYFEGNKYKCISLIDKDSKYISDIICKSDDIQYYYSDIKGEDTKLDKYVSKLNNYEIKKEKLKSKIDADPVILYTNNMLDKHYIVLQNYKGIYLINKKDNVRNIELFKNDVYTNLSSTIIKDCYLTADYNKDYKFHELYLVNIKNGKKKIITSNKEISLDSYIQGTVGKEAYLFDNLDKKQYRINIKNKTVNESGNTKNGIQVYNNKEFTKGSAYKASSSKIYFNEYSSDITLNDVDYYKVDKVGNKKSGYYYLYKKNDDKYDVYRANVQNTKILTYLFTTDSINTYYYDDFVYYKSGNYIKYYQNDLGNKTLIKDSEFEFNDSLKFGLYVD